jgi:hypothetical protein
MFVRLQYIRWHDQSSGTSILLIEPAEVRISSLSVFTMYNPLSQATDTNLELLPF